MTYNTAASTTVMATIRMVAITGDTAASSFLMIVFIACVLLVLASRRGPRGLLDRATIAPQQVERVRGGRRRQREVVARHAEVVTWVHGLLAADVGPVDPVDHRVDGHRREQSTRRRHGDRGAGIAKIGRASCRERA